MKEKIINYLLTKQWFISIVRQRFFDKIQGDIWIDENGDIFMVKNDKYKISSDGDLLDIPMNKEKQKTCWMTNNEETEKYGVHVYKLHDIRDNW
jgi:hypothetical protein